MKKTIILFLLITTLYAQEFKVSSIEKLQINQEAFYPQFGNNENEIFFTKSNYQGISKFDLVTKSVTQINNDLSAGYEFSIDGQLVYYRSEEVLNNKRFFKYVEQSLSTLSKNNLTELERNITTPRLLGNSLIKINSENEIQNIKSINTLQKSNRKEVVIANNKLLLLDDSGEKEINIFENGYYLWASMSPDQNKILFHFSGKGTFVIDLQGNILKELGNANFPSWSGDGRFILYMNDQDDGHKILESDVMLYNYESEQRVNLTSSLDDIAMFPKAAENMNKIVFSNMKGELYIINLISE